MLSLNKLIDWKVVLKLILYQSDKIILFTNRVSRNKDDMFYTLYKIIGKIKKKNTSYLFERKYYWIQYLSNNPDNSDICLSLFLHHRIVILDTFLSHIH